MRIAIATAAAILTALSGCGGSETPAASKATPAATASASATPEPEQASSGPAKVAIKGFAYKPATLTVKPGTKVTWTDDDAANHTVTFSKGPGDLGNVDQGDTVSASFEKPGSFAYVCQYHPNMKGTITVR